MSDKCPLCGDSMIFTIYAAHMDEDGTTRDEQCCHIVDGEACLRRQLAALKEENAAMAEVLGSIQVYSSDTLSGRTDGPEDREWFREGIAEVYRRASDGLRAGQGQAAKENPHA